MKTTTATGSKFDLRIFLVTGGWFGLDLVLLVPDFGLLFNRYRLGARHAIRQDFGEILAAFLTASARQHCPEVSLIDVFWDAVAAPIKQS